MGSGQFPKLNYLSWFIWQWCESVNLRIFAFYIDTAENMDADQASRKFLLETDSLNQNAFDTIIASFGTPELDSFASLANR